MAPTTGRPAAPVFSPSPTSVHTRALGSMMDSAAQRRKGNYFHLFVTLLSRCCQGAVSVAPTSSRHIVGAVARAAHAATGRTVHRMEEKTMSTRADDATPAGRGLHRLAGPYAALHGNANLTLLFSGQVVSALGDWLYLTALIVLVYDLTHSATLAAALT